MNELIKLLLSLSISGTLLLLLILGLKQFYKHKFSRRWQYYIWLLAALRFMLPFTAHTTIVGSLFETFETTTDTEYLMRQHDYPGSNINFSESEKFSAGQLPESGALHPTIDIPLCLFLIWFIFSLILLSRKIVLYQRFIHKIKLGNSELSDLETLQLLSGCRQILHIKKPVTLYHNVLISSPVMIGFFHPSILLPARKLKTHELYYIFTHELIHYKRKDLIYKWFIQVIICIHWFNPFAYLLLKETNKDCELSCDEAVISVFGEQAKREYGNMLLSFLKANSAHYSSAASIPLTEGAKQIKERLGAIMEQKKKSKTITIIMVFFTAAICICFLATGAYAAPEETQLAELHNIELKFPELEESELETSDFFDDNEITTLYYYTQQCYYQEPYLIELGWNLNEQTSQPYAKLDIALKDNTNVMVCFAESTEKYIKDTEAISAVSDLIYSLKTILILSCSDFHLENYPTIELPLVRRITYVPEKDIPTLAETYYQNRDYSGFSVLFPLLSQTIQKEYLQKIYQANDAALFSIVTVYMSPDTCTYYLEKADQEDNVAFFSMLLDVADTGAIKQYAKKYYETDNISRFSLLLEYMTQKTKQQWLAKAKTDQKTTFYHVLSESLPALD